MDGGGVPGVAQGPWYLTTGQRVVGAISGIVAVLFGIWAAVSLSPTCVISGILQICGGVLLLAFEAPFLVGFLSSLNRLAGFWENRPLWYKVILYAILGTVPLLLCIQITGILASAGIILTAVLYGLAAVGRRGAAAVPGTSNEGFHGQPYSDVDKSGLVESQMYSQSNMR